MRSLTSLLAIAALLAAAPAHASPDAPPPVPAPAPPDPDAIAPAPTEALPPWRQLLDEGRRLFADEADYAEALDRFERSYQLVPNWNALNGVALVHQQQGLYVDAYATYQRLLDEFEAVLTPEQTERVERRIAWLRARIGVLELEVSPARARVLVDGIELVAGAHPPPVYLMPGRHTVIADHPGHDPMSYPFTIAAGATRTLEITLRPATMVVQRAHFVRPMKPWLPWVTIGGGVIAAGVAGLLRVDAGRDFDAAQDLVRRHWERDQRPVVLEDESLFQRAQTKNAFAIGIGAAAGAAVITGVVLAILNQPRARYETHRVPRIGPSPVGTGLSLTLGF